MDITKISTSQLERDLKDSRDDISLCESALAIGIKNYSYGSVTSRLQANEHFVKVITAELNHRANL